MTPGDYFRLYFARSRAKGDPSHHDFVPEQAERYFRNASSSVQGQVIGDATAQDLDLDAVFASLDHTSSRVGQQYLYALMRMPGDERSVAEFIRHTSLFEADPALAARCKKHLHKVDDPASNESSVEAVSR